MSIYKTKHYLDTRNHIFEDHLMLEKYTITTSKLKKRYRKKECKEIHKN